MLADRDDVITNMFPSLTESQDYGNKAEIRQRPLKINPQIHLFGPNASRKAGTQIFPFSFSLQNKHNPLSGAATSINFPTIALCADKVGGRYSTKIGVLSAYCYRALFSRKQDSFSRNSPGFIVVARRGAV